MLDGLGRRRWRGPPPALASAATRAAPKPCFACVAACSPKAHPSDSRLRSIFERLQDWASDTHGQQGFLVLAADERAAVARALIDTSGEAQAAAVSAVDAWIRGALDFFGNARRDDDGTSDTTLALQAGEAMRAVEWGGATMAALFS